MNGDWGMVQDDPDVSSKGKLGLSSISEPPRSLGMVVASLSLPDTKASSSFLRAATPCSVTRHVSLPLQDSSLLKGKLEHYCNFLKD